MLMILVEFNIDVRFSEEGELADLNTPNKVSSRRVSTGTCAVRTRLFKIFS